MGASNKEKPPWPAAAMHRGLSQKRCSRQALAGSGAAIHSAFAFCSTKDADTDNLNEACSSEGVI
jgi:hypothetical protein